MKVTIVHTNNKKQLLVSTKTMEKLLERIAKDDSKNTVTHFREHVPYMENNNEYYKDMPTWMHIYPAAEFVKDENNNLKMKACNGILLLKFGNITDANGVEGVKRSVAMLPSTFAALEGADGKSVIVLAMKMTCCLLRRRMPNDCTASLTSRFCLYIRRLPRLRCSQTDRNLL